MKRQGQKFSWQTFLEGMTWVLFAVLIFGGLGVTAITSDVNQPSNAMIGWFYLIAGVVLSVLLTWASYDTAWKHE